MEFEGRQIRTMKSRELLKFARQNGLYIETGNGRHGTHLVAENGNRMPVPTHGGRQELARGTLDNLLGFIVENRAQSN